MTSATMSSVRAREFATSPARHCPVCGADTASTIHRQCYALFEDSALPKETAIVACDACGMVYVRSIAQAAAYRRHYAMHSKYAAATARGSGEQAGDAARLDELADRLAAWVGKAATVLDIGASRGGLLQALRRAGFRRVSGLDPAAGCVSAMRDAGFEAHVADLEHDSWPTDPGRFDVAVLSHVVEHVFDADDAFRRIAGRVHRDGSIYLEVPDAMRYTVDGFPPFYFFDPEHINHFDAASLQALAVRHGWTTATSWPRILDLGNGQRYPALGVLLRRTDGLQVMLEMSGVGPCADAVGDYVRHSAGAMGVAADVATLDRLATGRKPVVVWGAGSHAQRLLALTPLGRCTIDCFIDVDPGKQGRRLVGYSVVSPEDGIGRAARRSASIVVAIAVGGGHVVERLRSALPSHAVTSL